MSDFNSLYQQGLYLSPDQQDLLLAALSSNKQSNNSSQKPQDQQQQQNQQQKGTPQMKTESDTPGHASSGSFSASPTGGFDPNQMGAYGYGNDESPFLDFNPEVDFDFPGSESLIGDLPGGDYEPGDKRKDIDGDNENEESGKKRRESDDKTSKKPGRKPLTSEPTSKRKAQNRAAQRAFRERKEKHLKDLETKVEELQKNSDDANQENGLLRAQVERLQVELREYRKRLSWVTSGNGVSAMNAIPGAYSKGMYGLKNNDFLFDFPKFGDLPGSHIFNNSQMGKANQDKSKDNQTSGSNGSHVPGVLSRNSPNSSYNSPNANSGSGTPTGNGQNSTQRNASASNPKKPASTNDQSNSDSPSSSSDSHQSQILSSSGTSPEPSVNYSGTEKQNESGDGHSCTMDGEKNFCAQLGLACGNIRNPIPAVRHGSESASNTPVRTNQSVDTPAGLDSLAQENGGQFDPVLFGDWREPQDAVLTQDFGTFFDDAFPLPELGSPSHNFDSLSAQQAPKKNLVAQIDNQSDEEVVPGEDKSQMLSCTKIWDRLQSMERFRNGEIDVDNLCSELRTKARCSEGGVVVNQRDVDDIMGRAK